MFWCFLFAYVLFFFSLLHDPCLIFVFFCSMERDLMTRTDRFGVEVRERTMWDIRDGVVGAETFVPKHVVIATWKNVSFAGGIDNSLFTVGGIYFFCGID